MDTGSIRTRIGALFAAVAVIAVVPVSPAEASHPSITIVHPGDMAGWSVSYYDGVTRAPRTDETVRSSDATLTDQAGTAAGYGHFALDVKGEDTALSTQGDKVFIETSDHNGASLSDLSAFEYSTFIDTAAASGPLPYLNVKVDTDGDGAADDTLVFSPADTPSNTDTTGAGPAVNTWQSWDTLGASQQWWATSTGIGSPFTGLSSYPDFATATLATDQPAVRIVTGSTSSWSDFIGGTSHFRVNGTFYDFEGSLPAETFSAAIDDVDGFVNAAEASSGVPVTWSTSDTSATAAKVWFEDASGAMPSGCGPWTLVANGSGALNASCATNAPEGGITMVAQFFAGSTFLGQATDATTKDSIAPAAGTVDVQDGDGFVNAAEVADGVGLDWANTDPDATSADAAFVDSASTTTCTRTALPASGAGASIPDECFDTAAQGAFSVDFTWFDDAGNTSSASDTSVLDTVGPSATMIVRDGGDGFLNASEASLGLRVTWEVTDVGPDVTITAANTGEAPPGGCTFTTSDRGPTTARIIDSACVASLADGEVTATVSGTDAAGNPAEASDITDLDRVAEIAITSATDPINSSNVTAADVAGTSEPGASVSVTLSDTASTVLGPLTPAVDANGDWSLSGLDLSAFADGDVTIVADAGDPAGNAGSTSLIVFKDTAVAAGTLQIVDGDGFINAAERDAGVTVNFSHSASDMESAQLWFTDVTGIPAGCGPFTVAPTGTFTLDASCLGNMQDGRIFARMTWEDGAGNTSAQKRDRSDLDTVAPVGTIDLLDGDGFVNASEAAGPVPVSWEMTDVASVDVSLAPDGGAAPTDCVYASLPPGPVTGAIQPACFAALADGDVVAAVEGVDTAGNVGRATDASVLDRVAQVAITSVTDPVTPDNASSAAADGTTEDGATVDVSATDGAATSATVPASVTGTSFSATGLDLSSLADGTITYTATATDPAGNSGSATLDALKDATAPTLALAFDDADGVITHFESTVVFISGSTEPGAQVDLSIGSNDPDFADTIAASVAADGAGSFTTGPFDLSGFPDGGLLATAVATDGVGNASPETTATIDKAPDATTTVIAPKVRIIDGGDGLLTPNDEDLAAVEIVVTHRGLTATADVNLEVTDSASGSVAIPVGILDRDVPVSVFADVSGLADGPLAAAVTVTDGVQSATGSDTVILDQAAPVSTWSTADDEQFIRMWNPLAFITFGCCTFTSGSLEGATQDSGTPVQFVYIDAKNLDTGDVEKGPARMSARSSQSVSWSYPITAFEPGEWEVSVYAGDEAGNVESPKTIHIFVDGL